MAETSYDHRMERYVEIAPVAVDEQPCAHHVFLRVGNQRFCVTPIACETKEDAERVRDTLFVALDRVVADQAERLNELDELDAAAIQRPAVAQRLLQQTYDVIRLCEEVLRCTSALAAAELRNGSTSAPPSAGTCANGALPRAATDETTEAWGRR
jgi:hypothetical protein